MQWLPPCLFSSGEREREKEGERDTTEHWAWLERVCVGGENTPLPALPAECLTTSPGDTHTRSSPRSHWKVCWCVGSEGWFGHNPLFFCSFHLAVAPKLTWWCPIQLTENVTMYDNVTHHSVHRVYLTHIRDWRPALTDSLYRCNPTSRPLSCRVALSYPDMRSLICLGVSLCVFWGRRLVSLYANMLFVWMSSFVLWLIYNPLVFVFVFLFSS